MVYYTTEYGGTFDDYDEAVVACMEDQSPEDFEEFFGYQVSYTKLLNWAMKQPTFHEDFYDEIEKANNEYLNEMITEREEDEEEDYCFEPGRPFISMFDLNP